MSWHLKEFSRISIGEVFQEEGRPGDGEVCGFLLPV